MEVRQHTSKTCSECRAWYPDVTLPAYLNRVGQCRRHPPSVVKKKDNDSKEGLIYWWPITKHDDWCSELEE